MRGRGPVWDKIKRYGGKAWEAVDKDQLAKVAGLAANKGIGYLSKKYLGGGRCAACKRKHRKCKGGRNVMRPPRIVGAARRRR